MTYCITTKQTDIGEEIILHENTLLMYEDFCVYNKDEVEIPFEYDKVKKAFENGNIIRISEEDFNRLKGIYMNLSSIKVAAFDFDDTLAVHKDKDYVAHRKALNEDNYFKTAYLYPNGFYESIEICTAPLEMQSFISYLRSLGTIKLYCVSGMKHTLHFKAKEAFIHKHYGSDIELIAAGSQERKADVLRVLQSVYDCRADEVLFVDDRQSTVDLLCKQGFRAILAGNIPTLSPDGVSFTSVMDD